MGNGKGRPHFANYNFNLTYVGTVRLLHSPEHLKDYLRKWGVYLRTKKGSKIVRKRNSD